MCSPEKRRRVFSGRKRADEIGRCAGQPGSWPSRALVCPRRRWSSHSAGRRGGARASVRGAETRAEPSCSLSPGVRILFRDGATQGPRRMSGIPKQPVTLLVLEESQLKVGSKLVTRGGLPTFFFFCSLASWGLYNLAIKN